MACNLSKGYNKEFNPIPIGGRPAKGTLYFNFCIAPDPPQECVTEGEKNLPSAGYIVTEDGACMILSARGEKFDDKELLRLLEGQSQNSLHNFFSNEKNTKRINFLKKFLQNQPNPPKLLPTTTKNDKKSNKENDVASYTRWSYIGIQEEGNNGFAIVADNTGLQTPNFKQVTFRVICDEDSTIIDPDLTYDSAQNFLTITIKHEQGCGRSTFGPLAALYNLGWPVSVAGLILGVVACFFGSKYLKPGLALISFIIV